MFPASNS
jgi:hypothetical protein